MGLLDSLFGKRDGASGPYAKSLEQHFAALDKAETGLARRTAAYVADGSGESVLATLEMPKVAGPWRQRLIMYTVQVPSAAMLAAEAYDVLVRYGEVMSLLEPMPTNSSWGHFGSTAAPAWLRHAITTNSYEKQTVCSVDTLARLAEHGGAPFEAVLDIFLHTGPGIAYGTLNSFDKFPGAADWLAANAEAVSAHKDKLDAAGRAELAAAIGRFGLSGPFLGVLVDLGISSAKTVRTAAMQALTAAARPALADALAERYAAASAGARSELVNLAIGTLGADAAPLLEKWRESETQKKPLEAINRGLATLSLGAAPAARIGPWDEGYVALDGSTVALPERVPPPPPSRIPDSVYDLIRASMDSYNATLNRIRDEAKQEKQHWSRSHALLGEPDLDRFRRQAEGDKVSDDRTSGRGLHVLMWADNWMKFDRSGVAAFFADPAVTVRHLLRMAGGYGLLSMLSGQLNHAAAQELRRRIATPEQLRMVADLWAERGATSAAQDYLAMQWGASLENFEPGILWAHVADSFDSIDEALGLRPQSGARPYSPSNALDLLGTLPKVPHRYLLPLMTIATGTQKAMRLKARELLGGAADIDGSIAELLGDGRQEARAGAADWLAARGARGSIPALRRALGKEKSDVARAAIITALEKLGDDVSDCFDTRKLRAEAETGLAKTSAKGLDWFPFDLLPRLSWRDGGAVDPQIVRWWVVLAAKLKQPGGNALLDLWLDRVEPQDAERLSRFVLRGWIEQDTRTATEDEANAHAAAHVDALLQQNRNWARQHPQYASYYVTDRDKLFANLKREKLGIYLGSASESRGVLALATRAVGADAAAAVRAFLKDHGSRVSQAKALLDMLAANPSAAAIQVVLSTANRFKARTVQEHAAALIERIAELRGWSRDELADRTIPTAGLDEKGEAELDCGEGRMWRLALGEGDALVLLNPAGHPAKALPAARNDEEKPLVADAKKLVANARKELKQVLAAQTERLYEAMCLERRWPAGEWEQYLLRHPIVGRLARRLVWIGHDEAGERVTLFRPLDDGTLSDSSDNAVTIDGIASVQVAHASLVGADEAEAWRAHLDDYEVAPLFAQFDRDLPQLPDAMKEATAIEDRRGWMIETFKLRGIANKLGYLRGAAQDGGVFMTYERRYESAGLVAEIEFTGSPLPEENRPGALHELRFTKLRRGASGWNGPAVPLKEVPPVLLGESWKDLHKIAAAGTGFDPDWENKAGW